MKKKFFIFVFLSIIIIGRAENHNSSLKKVYTPYFKMGVAINPPIYTKAGQKEVNLVQNQFNLISPENVLKWESIHGKRGQYDFDLADEYVGFGTSNNMNIYGHVLVWHSQTPDWIYLDQKGDTVSREKLLSRMRKHIQKVAGRYKGEINTWDVVNEAFLDNGDIRKSNWYKIIGKDFIKKAFLYAEQTIPEAKLGYNDYNMYKKGKRNSVVEMLSRFQDEDIPIDFVGMQAHWGLESPSIQKIEKSIVSYYESGANVRITELDIDVLPSPENSEGADVSLEHESKEKFNPYPNQLPDSVQNKLAQRYKEIFELFIEHSEKIKSVTLWGATDRYSWLNNWPIRGRTNYPLLFNREAEPKKAYYEVIKAAQDAKK